MSVSWGDYDRDGIFDLYVGNMFSAAGNRVGAQDKFAPGRGLNEIQEMRKMYRGNTLYRGTEGRFSNVTRDARVSMGRWAWSSGFVDINNDGSFGSPKNLGSKFNTEGRENFPFISDDGTLYFSSDSHIGLGGFDVFMIKDDKVVNVGKPINSQRDDFGYIIDEKKCYCIIS